MTAEPTARQVWQDAVWESSSLTPTQRLIAHAIAKYAGADTERVWVASPELQRVTALGRTAVLDSVRTLCNLGWLEVTERARQNRAPRYRLLVPLSVSARDTLNQAEEARVSAADTLDTLRVSARGSQSVGSRHRTTKNHRAREDAALCEVCSRPEDECRRAESKVPASERHAFQAAA